MTNAWGWTELSDSNQVAALPNARTAVTHSVVVLVVTMVAVLLAAGPPPAAAAPPPTDPVVIAADLIAAEQALRDPSSSDAVLTEAARRQQMAYRALGNRPDWIPVARAHIPPALLFGYDRNVDARRQLMALTAPKDSLPAWQVVPPAPADELLGYYRAAEQATGVDWNYLAAINMVETGFGRIAGASDADAQGPMQFLPSTFAAYGDGGDIRSPRDSIMAAGRLLAANGFARNRDRAVFQYNHADQYVRAVDDYAAVLAADPAAFIGYYRWDTYYRTTSGDVLLPIGYNSTTRIPVSSYLATHPQ